MKINHPRQIVELFHLHFLNFLGRKIDKKLYALKGGCNMRFYFGSIRYSEDMDIDIQTIARETLRKNVNQVLNSVPFSQVLQAKEITILQMSEPKQTGTTQRWKILLKSSNSVMPLSTKIEFSRREFSQDTLFEVINPEILSQYSLMPIMANHYSRASIYEQKILALALRKETQARDIFDLYLLINSGVNPTIRHKKTRENLVIARDNALSITFSDFKGQVIAYLLDDYVSQYDSAEVWHTIVDTVIKSLDECRNEIN